MFLCQSSSFIFYNFFLHLLVCLSLLISCVTVQSVMSNYPRVLFCIERAKAMSYGETDKVQDHKLLKFPPLMIF